MFNNQVRTLRHRNLHCAGAVVAGVGLPTNRIHARPVVVRPYCGRRVQWDGLATGRGRGQTPHLIHAYIRVARRDGRVGRTVVAQGGRAARSAAALVAHRGAQREGRFGVQAAVADLGRFNNQVRTRRHGVGGGGGDVGRWAYARRVDGRDPVVAGAARRQPGVGVAGGGGVGVGSEVAPGRAVCRDLDPVSRDGRSAVAGGHPPRQIDPRLPVGRRRQVRGRPRGLCRGRAEQVEVYESDHLGLGDGVSSRAEEVVVDGRYDLALIDRPVVVIVVPVNQWVPRRRLRRYRHRGIADHRMVLPFRIHQGTGEGIETRLVGRGDGVGERCLPLQGEYDLLRIDIDPF